MSNSLNIGEKIKYVFGALEIAKRNREGRELEIIKSANRMVEQLETELADKEKQSKEIFPQNIMGIENVQKMAFDLADHACCGLYSEKDIKDFIEKWRKNNDC